LRVSIRLITRASCETEWTWSVAVSADHTAVVTATLQVHSVSQLARVMSRIETLKDVISVQRDLG